jgi:3-hydroxyisobutyrate dehydrogenase
MSNVGIGLVGVGRMGANMARRLKDTGYQITAVQDQNRDAARTLGQELRCEAVALPARVAELSEIVVTAVSDDAAMREIYAEGRADSLLLHSKDRLFINCATITPGIHIEIELKLEQRGGASLEACMAGSITQARQGKLYLMCGGKPATFERAKPLLESLGSTLRYIGKAGEAAKVKALVNMVMNCNTAALGRAGPWRCARIRPHHAP